MRKNSSKKVGRKNNLIIESNQSNNANPKSMKLQDKLLELEDSEIEALFEAGRITQDEYEYILKLRKKKKARKKSEKEQFEERIRCDDTVISKIIHLGRRFRIEDLLAHGKWEEARKVDLKHEFLEDEQEYQIDVRTRDKQKEERLKQKYLDRSARCRGRERDTR